MPHIHIAKNVIPLLDKSLDSSTPTYIIVPNRSVATVFRHRIAAHLKGHHKLYFLTLDDLALKLAFPKLVAQQRQKMDLVFAAEYFRLNFRNQPLPEGYCENFISSLEEMFGFASHPASWFENADVAQTATNFLELFSKNYFLPRQLIYEILYAQESLTDWQRILTNLFYVPDVFLWPLEKAFLEYLGRYFPLQPLALDKHSLDEHQTRLVPSTGGNEAESVVQCILHDTQQALPQKKTVGILLRSLKKELPSLTHHLDRARIPYHVLGGMNLSETLTGQGIIESSQLLFSRKTRKKVLHTLAAFPLTPEKQSQIGSPAEWDEWTQLQNISHFENAEGKKKLSLLSDPRAPAFFTFLNHFLTALHRIETSKNLMISFSKFLSEWMQNSSDLERIGPALKFLDKMHHSPVWLEQLTTWEQTRFLREFVSRAKLETKENLTANVCITTYERALGLSFDAVYLPDVSSFSVPKPFHPHPLVSPQQEDKIRAWHVENENHLFLSASNAAPLVTFSYTDEPSSYLAALGVDDSSKPNLDICLDIPDWIHKFGRYQSPFLEKSRLWLSQKIISTELTAHDGILKNLSLPAHGAFSPSFLESYAECPYQSFLKHHLRLVKEEDPEDFSELIALDRGTLIHDILDTFYKLRIQDAKVGVEAVDDISEAIFKKFENDVSRGLGVFWPYEKRLIIQDLKLFLKRDLEESELWVPAASEAVFENLSIDLGNRRVSMKGRIDRLDVSPDRKKLRVIDYKTGKGEGERSNSFKQGKRMQLPVYMLAAAQIYKDAHLNDIDGYLLFTSLNSGFKKVYVEGKFLEENQTLWKDALSSLFRGVFEGIYFQNPGDNGVHCRNCAFTDICGPDVEKISDRKRSDSRTHVLIPLTELP